jgi:hypothetical protein
VPQRPNLFIVGAPKTGTTSLHRYLQQHPQVYMSRTKEPGYFAPDVVGARPETQAPSTEAEYLALFEGATAQQRWVGESSTIYLMSREAPVRISAFDPEARIVVMVRDPAELMHSLHNERVSGGSETITDFGEALAADDDRREGKRQDGSHRGYGVAYRDNALLGEQLNRWLQRFDKRQVHVIVFDDFARDTPGEFAKLLEFLEVDRTFRPESFATYNASHRPRRIAKLVKPLLRNRFSRWISKRVLPALFGEEGTVRIIRRLRPRRLTKVSHRPDPIAPALRLEIEREFTPDVRLLGELVGRDLVAEWFGSRGQTAERRGGQEAGAAANR